MTSADTTLLGRIAESEMAARDFLTVPGAKALAEAETARAPKGAEGVKDLTALPWTSIDNPESRDLDQIEVVEKADGGTRLYVGIADVERFVAFGSAVDEFAKHNTTSVYTGVRTFPMLPEKLCFDLTSLVAGQDRFAMVIETLISPDGQVKEGKTYLALVHNRAKLDYPAVSAWIDGKTPPPPGLDGAPELQSQVRDQDALARILAGARRRAGALDVDTGETRLVLDLQGKILGLKAHAHDRAGDIIEELMIASNRAVAMELDARGLCSVRRVVKEPERWDKIIVYAAQKGETLPPKASSLALSQFIDKMRKARLAEFQEISLALIKLIGRGEYVAHRPGSVELGHFGLAMDQYTHSTAPNRRYIDLVTQRILKKTHAYGFDELSAVAARASLQEAAAQKVERRVHKSASALLMRERVGETFDGVVTGAGDKGTFVRVLDPLVEGKVARGEKGLTVGDKVKVKLLDVNVERGYIDFQVVGGARR